MDARTAIALLENKRTIDEQNRMSPFNALAQGITQGTAEYQKQQDLTTQNNMNVKNYGIQMQMQGLKDMLLGDKYQLVKADTNEPVDQSIRYNLYNQAIKTQEIPPLAGMGLKLVPAATMVNKGSYFYKADKEGNLSFFGPDKQPVDTLPQGVKPIALKEDKEFTRKQDPYQFKINRLKAMGDDLDADKQVNNPYGIAARGYDRSKRLESLVSRYKDLNLDQRETEELAIGLNSILSGSNQSAQEQVKSLVPKSIIGNVQKLKEWLVNEPQGLNQQKFVQRMYNDVKREADTMYNQLMEKGSKKISKYNDIINNLEGLDEQEKQDIQQQYNDIITSRGIDLNDYNTWKKGGFKKKDVIPKFEENNQGWTPEKEKRLQELRTKQGK